jgi:hypothetical protein
MFLAVVAPTDLDLYAGLYGATMHQELQYSCGVKSVQLMQWSLALLWEMFHSSCGAA